MVDHAIDGATANVGNLLELDDVTTASAGHDVICHIGAIGDVYLAGEDPRLAASVNVVGTANIAEAARRNGARVVYASTWEVYGKAYAEVIDEDHPCEPDHPYSITKLAGERMLLAADHLQDVPVVALRLGTAYGTGLRKNSVFRLFIDKARAGDPISIQGDGNQYRQFTHASDIARAFTLACRSDVRGRVYNTVATDPVSIKQLAELVVERFPTDIVYAPARAGDVHPAMVSSERARRELGWSAEMPFEQGVAGLMDEASTD
jgi:UDP-glucose 4-epimerase